MQASAQPAPAAITTRTGPLRGFLRNLLAGLAFLALRPGAPNRLVPTVPQLILLLLLPMGLSLGLQLWRLAGSAQFNPAGLPPMLFGIPWLLLAAWTSARWASKEALTLAAAVALATLWLAVDALRLALTLLPLETWRSLGQAALWLWWGPVAWGLLASLPALAHTIGMDPRQRLSAVPAVLCFLSAPLFLQDDNPPIVTPRHDPAAAAANRARWEPTTRETILYAQPRLLDAALGRIQPGRPGVPEIFLLAVGGHGGQDVFLREVKAVEALFQQRFATAGHSMVLVNNPATVGELPIASVTALERSLARIGQQMNRDEDVLFLFMTSHGAQDHRFDLSLWPYRFDDLTPQRLRAMLDQAGIRYRVVLVSACYSGGFVPALAGEDTLAMSAAAADRNSHGCSHQADWTFFGRAYFQEALNQTRSFEAAFDQASQAVAKREVAEGLEASLPQMAVGNGIRVALRALERQKSIETKIFGVQP
ncbi:MAG: C13 family peptidase [Rhodocyclaceae bacterium]|nr:C13 family peptidase [Rhodocyclaceae bacterium]